jgi:hypothetical protein
MAITDSEALHPAAPHHLPFFITAPGTTDVLLLSTGLFLLAAVIAVGVLYFKLHALPEQMAHRGQKIQFELVAVLALLALFTHNHAFWVAGLLLALLPLPDFTTPLTSISSSLEKLASNATQPAPVSRDGHATPGRPAPPEPTAAQAAAPAADVADGHQGGS